MKLHSSFTLAALLIGLGFYSQLHAQGLVKYESQPGSKVKLDGSSNIHDWTVESQIIAGFMEWESTYPLDPSQATPPQLKVTPKVDVSIPVRSLKSGKTTMDKVMYEAMGMATHPKIEYKLKEMTVSKEARKAGDPIKFDTKGELTVSGKTKPISMVVAIEKGDGESLKAKGTTPVKMSDYGIAPPAPKIALGMIKTSEDVKVTFEWITKKAP